MTQTKLTASDVAKCRSTLLAVRAAGITQDGQLWVRPAGFGETADDLDTAMESADKLIERLGFERNPDAPIFRDGLAWGQSLRRK